MQQLVMDWKNDFSEIQELNLPEGYNIVSFPDLDGALDAWLDIVQYGISGDKRDESYFIKYMSDKPYFNPKFCYFVTYENKPIATITVICDTDKLHGLIHMVACMPEFRGKGIGRILNILAVNTLKENGMKTAYLTTDDWRLPAIKGYLKSGFTPNYDVEDGKARWEAVLSNLGM